MPSTLPANMTAAPADTGYESFRRLAVDPALSEHGKIGFPDAYRAGHEAAIFADITAKLANLAEPGRTVLEIGPGCAGLPRRLIGLCEQNGHQLVLVDSPEMLGQLPNASGVVKVPGRYPDCADALLPWRGRVDALLCYSVFQYLFVEAAFLHCLDLAIDLLAPGGQMLIGDLPNISKRKRFFASEAGVRFHQRFMQTDGHPHVDFRAVEHHRIDDAAIVALLLRARAQGCDAYWLPQPASLPMANRREDVLIVKP